MQIGVLAITVWVTLALAALGSFAASLIFISIATRRIAVAIGQLAEAELEEPTARCGYCGGLRDVAVAPEQGQNLGSI
jgi:hypothetical protein